MFETRFKNCLLDPREMSGDGSEPFGGEGQSWTVTR